MENKKNKIRGLICILFTIMESTIEYLMEEEDFLSLSKNTMSEIIMEFLIFNLHQFNRTLYAWFGEEERNDDCRLCEHQRRIPAIRRRTPTSQINNHQSTIINHFLRIRIVSAISSGVTPSLRTSIRCITLAKRTPSAALIHSN